MNAQFNEKYMILEFPGNYARWFTFLVPKK